MDAHMAGRLRRVWRLLRFWSFSFFAYAARIDLQMRGFRACRYAATAEEARATYI